MSNTTITSDLIQELETITDPQHLLSEVFKRFGNRAAIGTSGQLTGVALIDLAVSGGVLPRVFTIDTERLFPETYQLFKDLEQKYKIVIERARPNAQKIKTMVEKDGEFLFFDSKEKQEFCCHLRKVEPNQTILKTVDVWITGLRNDQSMSRSKKPKFQIITHPEDKHPILKIAPLMDWTEAEVREYIKKKSVPMHPLLKEVKEGEWYYESLGCVICTTPIGPFESRRAGRWRWFNDPNNKECGIHEDNDSSFSPLP